MKYYYLEIIKGQEKGRYYTLEDGSLSMGRSSTNIIALFSGEKAVSGRHAIIYKSSEKILIQDMQSTNGTFVNENKIHEKELNLNDIIGFGKMGPRLKLIVSETEIDVDSYKSHPSEENTCARTIENTNNTPKEKPSTSSTVNATRTSNSIITKHGDKEQVIPLAASMTMEMEQKLLQGEMDADDMHSLMKNSRRLEKIIDRGKLEEGHSALLASAYGAGQKTKKQWMVILGVVAGVSLLIISLLGVRMFQYKQMLNKGLSLEDKLDYYEKEIFKENQTPNGDKRILVELIKELEETKAQLSSVKENIKDDDFKKFYTDTTEMFIDEIMVRFGETDYHIPPKMVERVKYHIDIYSGRMKRTIGKYLKRKHKYFPMIREIFTAKNLPIELAYISMLESGFNPTIKSHAGARGLWQFMPATGRRFGLKVNKDVDERCLPKKSTYAAAEYFKDLIAEFGGKSSIMLAMASYNAGEGRVRGALRKIEDPMRNRDFWYIYRMGYLAEETNEYIPRMLALMIIDENQVLYGFASPSSSEEVTNKHTPVEVIDF